MKNDFSSPVDICPRPMTLSTLLMPQLAVYVRNLWSHPNKVNVDHRTETRESAIECEIEMTFVL